MMYTIGDKILYPMHGAGVIQKIEDRDILGETRQYYIMRLPFDDMNVMIPVNNSTDIGIRPVISPQEVEAVFFVLRADTSQMSGNWNRRQRENMEMLKSGDIFKVAEVVRNLIRANRIKKLSAGEKKLLTNAKQILESELILAGDIDPQQVDHLVEDAV